MGFLTGPSAWALLCGLSCYRPLTTSPFCLMGSATGGFLLPAPYYRPFFPHGLCYRPFLLPPAYYQPFLSESMGHAMAETPAGAARALLYIVGTSPTFILHQSINHSYHTFHQVMSPDRRAHSLKKHLLYSIVLLRSLTSRATSKFAARKTQNLGGTTKCNVAVLRLPTIHQPATRCDSILFSNWWNDELMLTMICPAFHYFDVQTVNFDSQSSQHITCATRPTSFSRSFFSLTSPYYIQALFAAARSYFRQCAHISIVGCWA